MILIDQLIISEDILDKEFVCNLSVCKGACCVAGESGAPLDKEELAILKKEYKNYSDYLSEQGKQVIASEGYAVYDSDEEKYKTPLIEGGPCAYIHYDEDGIAYCGIEKAYLAGKTTFKKPISCHLYPIRVTRLKNGSEALNYERWNVCKSACTLGKKLQVPIYQFLKEPIIRKWGNDVYQAMDAFYKRENTLKR